MLEARRWYTSRPRALPPREQAFIDAVLALAKRTQRTRRLLLATAFTVLAAFAVVASVGYVRVKAAETQAKLEAQAGEMLSREELVKKNGELQASLADQKAARDRAEAASKKAEANAAEAQRLQKELQVKLDEEKARVKQLQEEMKKISTKLKDF